MIEVLLKIIFLVVIVFAINMLCIMAFIKNVSDSINNLSYELESHNKYIRDGLSDLYDSLNNISYSIKQINKAENTDE